MADNKPSNFRSTDFKSCKTCYFVTYKRWQAHCRRYKFALGHEDDSHAYVCDDWQEYEYESE